ncbi:hypothetical protein [Marinobacter caseinilyticus]|uniref:hypothetical protein n=1 Tax=Marinobacter caseinilyticus TaxID=2692195 RepID=UPI00140CB51D|nr:hypothetical protein [Marinobacter caseinilyticus]
MSKQFSTLETTRILFEHPKVMFHMIERMDRVAVHYVLETDLIRYVLDYSGTLKKADQARLRRAFSTDNLFRSGVVIDIDKVQGERRLVFQDALLGLMRACNASLYQELTDARLRSYLVTLRDVLDRLRVSSFHEADPDFTELRDDLNERVSRLIGLLRQNIFRMQTISAELAELSDEASRGKEQFSDFRQNLFEQITTLYERHIKPTLVLLNPDSQLEDGANLFAIMDGIQDLLERNDQQASADQVFRASLSLNAMHRPIQKVAVEVDHFLRKTRRGMVQYNAMEHHFQHLQTLLEATRTQDLRKTRLDGRGFVRSSSFMSGLKASARPKQYAFGQSESYYQLLFSELTLRLDDLQRQHEAPVLPELTAQASGPVMDIQRIDTLFRWVDSLELRPTADLVRELHGRLEGFIDGYRFPDLLVAMNRLSNLDLTPWELVTTNRFRQLGSPENEHYIYRKRRLQHAGH